MYPAKRIKTLQTTHILTMSDNLTFIIIKFFFFFSFLFFFLGGRGGGGVGGGIAVGYSYSPSTWLPSISCLWRHPGSLARTKDAKYDPVKNNSLTSIDIRQHA